MLVCALIGSALASDRNAAPALSKGLPIHATITPCVPGVVYVQFREGAKIMGQIATKGSSVQSVGGDALHQAFLRLGILEIVPFDPYAPKDSIARTLGIGRMYCIYYSNTKIDPHAALTMLLSTGEVECGSARYLFPISKTPNDPLIAQQYALTNMNVFNAWNTTIGDTSVVIADVDLAVNIDHEDLKNALKINWGEVGLDAQGHDKRTNGIDDDSDGIIDDWDGADVVGDGTQFPTLVPSGNPRPQISGANHGTLTAGCAVATGDNGTGIAGIGYGCRLLAIKAGYDDQSIAAGYEGVQFAIDRGARIINCSWGGPVNAADVAWGTILIKEALARNALMVVAAGNFSVDIDAGPEYPADMPGVLCVGATDANDAPSSYSNYGHTVHVWAPGDNVLSTDYPGNSSYGQESGTSFSSPLTAGVAGLVASLHPDWPAHFIARQIIQTCDNVVNSNDRYNYWGRVNAGQAVTAAPGPGLFITGYSIGGVASDSLRAVGQAYDVKITFKNATGNGSNLTAVLVPGLGYTVSGSAVTLGTMAVEATASGDFSITRTGVYCEGAMPLRFAVGDGASYLDTLTLYLPLMKVPGFGVEQTATLGTSIARISHSDAWAAYGFEQTGFQTESAFAREIQGAWSNTALLNDGTEAPYDVTALDADHAWFGTGSSSTASVIFTNDGGLDFTSVDVSNITPFVNSIHFFDSLNGVFIGDPKSGRWGIGITTDGGNTWNPTAKATTSSGTIASWNNATTWVRDNGWFGTNSKQILHTTDRGQTWKTSATSYQHSLSVSFDWDGVHGIACFRPAGATSLTGANGIMLSSDGGSTWKSMTMPVAGMSPGAVQFISKTHEAILTSDVGIYRTTDDGATWSSIGIPVSYLSDGSDLSIYRGNGSFTVSTISSNSGIASYTEPLSDTIDDSPVAAVHGVQDQNATITLENSPNPFQHVSSISFGLPKREFVRLAVYDALGREVAVVVNAMMDAGMQTVPFHAENLEPGVYYCTLETEDGILQTRAMTLIK
ncbi:MAG TPA: S8 family serine peptidase [Candidatus Kapabacteria bacterium]|jgi:photosystem II stability/assembly factor-like uncharacterized protein|nr:S8 family serine peptidase [Candidatus Kapabacteria bacterium]